MGLVQVKPGSTTSLTTLSITLDNPTSAGSGLAVMISTGAATTNPTVSGITLGGSADHFAQAAVSGNTGTDVFNSCWLDLNCAAGQTAIVITATGGAGATADIIAWVYEFDNLLAASAFDKSSANTTAGTTWTSNNTAALSQANEVALGIAGVFAGSAPTLTGPSSPWVNQAQQNVGTVAAIAGHDILNSAAAIAYAGTASAGTGGGVLVVTVKLAAAAVPAPAAQYAPGWHPGQGLPGLPGGTPFYSPPGADAGGVTAATVSGDVALALTSAVTAAGTSTVLGSAAVTTTAAITAAATSTVLGAAAVSTACTITATAAIAGTTVSGDAALSVTDTITAAGTVTALAAAAVSTTAAITASGTGTDLAAASVATAATITASGTGTRLGAAAVSTACTITATATVTALGAAAVAGTATITAAGTGTRLAAAAVSATATITATATVGAAPVTGDAALALTAALTAAGSSTALAAAAVSGTATITAAGKLSPAAAAAAVTTAAAVTATAAATVRAAAAVTTTTAIIAAAEIPLPFTIGSLTATDKPGSVLTAAGAASALTASTAAGSTLTAGDQRTGGPA